MMSEAWKIILTSIATITGGIIVYTVGHLLVALFIEPIHRLRSLIGEIADSLVFYADVYSNPGCGQKERMDEASEVLRRQASQLRARAYSIPWYSLWSLPRLVRESAEIEDASAELIGLSNSIHNSRYDGVRNSEKREIIEKLLGIRVVNKRTQKQPINWHIMSSGILLFLFGLILLAVKQSTVSIFGYEIWEISNLHYQVLGLIAIILSLIFSVAIFYESLAVRLERFLEGMPRSYVQGVIKYLYCWLIFWLVYIVGWLKGLSGIPADSAAFHVAFWIGFIWFLVIGFAWFKGISWRRKRYHVK
ncbi:hypothetical protein ACFLUO_07090 [Chloroflexota bacterium]